MADQSSNEAVRAVLRMFHYYHKKKKYDPNGYHQAMIGVIEGLLRKNNDPMMADLERLWSQLRRDHEQEADAVTAFTGLVQRKLDDAIAKSLPKPYSGLI